jgi:hypothetical protein
MKNKIINYIFLLALISISTSVFSKTKLEAICEKSMSEMSNFYASSKNKFKLKQQINKEYKSKKMRKFLMDQWVPEMSRSKDFTPNDFIVQKREYTKKCVKFIRGN